MTLFSLALVCALGATKHASGVNLLRSVIHAMQMRKELEKKLFEFWPLWFNLHT
jgi:hypothetical protein